MDGIIKYSGISAITVSLFMLTLGSIPTSLAGSGQVTSNLSVNISCGIGVADGIINWNNPINPSVADTLDSTDNTDFSGTEPTITNPGTNTANANVNANVGDSTNGGYAGTVDGFTHIEPSEIALDLVNDNSVGSPVGMNDGAVNTNIGTLAPGETDTLQVVVTVTPGLIAGLPTTDTTWAATINLVASCVLA